MRAWPQDSISAERRLAFGDAPALHHSDLPLMYLKRLAG
jgi:hypothetical protein